MRDYSIKYGVNFNLLIPDTEFENDRLKFQYLINGFLRLPLLGKVIEGELGAGYGTLSGRDFEYDYWRTELVPVEARILISPFQMKEYNPFLYSGLGLLFYWLDNSPKSASPYPAEKSGLTALIPIGGGLEFYLSDFLSLEIAGGYNFTFSDHLNGYNNFHDHASGNYDGYWNIGMGLNLSAGVGDSDDDNDGLENSFESEIGTDPDLPDTDSDKLTDGEEVSRYKTNPLTSDSDMDGLNDYDEILTYKTNPLAPDTDGDTISDSREILELLTDPLKSDTDDDKISDLDEIDNFKTNPLLADTDSDMLGDNEEITLYKTNPIIADTDGDGLSDGVEIKNHFSNPLEWDSDFGSVDDFTEVNRGTNPSDSSDDVILDVSSPIVLEGVNFSSGRSKINPGSEGSLFQALKTLQAFPQMKVEIRGYTDNVGRYYKNMELSLSRAQAVRDWLIAKGINAERLTAKGFGEEYPIADNSTEEGKRKNRRIEFVRVEN